MNAKISYLALSALLAAPHVAAQRLASEQITPHNGRPPKLAWSTSIRLASADIPPGSEVRLYVDRRNISDEPIAWSIELKNPRITAASYHVEVRNERGELAPETAFGRQVRTGRSAPGDPLTEDVGSSAEKTVPPGGTFTDTVILNLDYDLSRPGKYTAQIVNRDDSDGHILLRSNVVSFNIVK